MNLFSEYWLRTGEYHMGDRTMLGVFVNDKSNDKTGSQRVGRNQSSFLCSILLCDRGTTKDDACLKII